MMEEASLHGVDQAATEEVVNENNTKLKIAAEDDETSSKADDDEEVNEDNTKLKIAAEDDETSSSKAEDDEEGEGEGEASDDEERDLYEHRDDALCREYRPLHTAALNGDWESAERFLTEHEGNVDIMIQGVNRMEMSILHVAANMGHAVFMWKLLRSRFFPKDEAKRKEALTKKDKRDLTPLHYAASVGNMNAIKLLVSLDNSLTQIGGDDDDDIPLILAADNKASTRVLWYLAMQTADSRDSGTFQTTDHPNPFSGGDGADLITSLVAVGHYDICLYLFSRYPNLASDSVSHWNDNEDGNYDLLGCLVCRPSEFPRRSKLSFWQRCIYELIPMGASNPQTMMAKVTHWILRAASNSLSYIVPGFKHIRDKKYQHKCIIELLNIACQKMSEWDVNEILSYFKETEVHYDAAEDGGTEIIRAFIKYFPDIMDDAYVEGQILIKAIQNRQENVYNIMMERGITVKFLPDSVDEKTDDNVLHTAARLAPYVRLTSVSCPALQMQRELQWFKAVEKFARPSMKILKNKDNKTPGELFTEEHKVLVKDAEKWMKETSNSCLVVATLIITVVFAAAFTIPGGLREDRPGVPLFLRRRSFILFVTSDAVGMFSSATSIFMFLSILTARYSENDFLYALPKRLILGLVSLLIAIASMMIAFGATLFLVIDPKSDFIIYPIIALSGIPVFLFIMLQLPLIIFMVRSTYGPSILKDKIMSKS